MTKTALFSHEIEVQLQENFIKVWSHEMDYMELNVVCKIFHPNFFTYYIISQDPKEPEYLWAIVDGYCLEIGSVSKVDLVNTIIDGTPFERDLNFIPKKAKEVFKILQKGE